MKNLKSYLEETNILFRKIPGMVMSFFFLSVVLMNLLANKELISTTYLALDCGFMLSWISFLCLDIVTKYFGAKAASRLSITALLFNLLVCLIFKIASMTPGMWAAYYDSGSMAVNDALNTTFGGTWYVLLGSSIAMLVSFLFNGWLNEFIGKRLQNNSFKDFALRSYISTALAQFVDNFIFAMLVSYVFFGWTMVQVIICSLTGAFFELLCEVILSPVGYRIVTRWEKEKVGKEYLDLIRG